VRAAIRFVADNLDEDISVEHVAAAAGLSDRRLRMLFKEQLGLTVVSFIAGQRMNVGGRLLRETGLTVQEVALEVGFKNPGNFATAFRERTGLTPHAYRESSQADGAAQE
jgi:transcriptional regulator GlxA family with amidase domain